MDGFHTFKFITIKLWMWCGVAEVNSMSCLLIQFLLTYSTEFSFVVAWYMVV